MYRLFRSLTLILPFNLIFLSFILVFSLVLCCSTCLNSEKGCRFPKARAHNSTLWYSSNCMWISRNTLSVYPRNVLQTVAPCLVPLIQTMAFIPDFLTLTLQVQKKVNRFLTDKLRSFLRIIFSINTDLLNKICEHTWKNSHLIGFSTILRWVILWFLNTTLA